MLVPKGYTEQQVIDTINKVLDNIAPKYKFGIYDIGDIKAEGFILAMKLLRKFDNSGPLENFLKSCLSNALKNFRRDHSYKLHTHCVSHDEFTKDCEVCENRQNNQLTKRKLLHPIDLDSVDPDGESNFVVSDDIHNLELQETIGRINSLLPATMRKDYLKMKEGLYVPRERRFEIEEEIRRIMDAG